MNEEEAVVVPQTTEEELEINLEEAEPNTADEPQEESVEEIKARLAKAEELAKNYKIRAEKAEGKKVPKTESTPANNADTKTLSTKDTLALIENKISSEDIETVEKYARFEGVSVAEALKSPMLKALLAEQTEKRQTAQATNVGTQRRSTVVVSDDVLLANAKSGKFPENDADIARVISAYQKNK